MVKGRKLTRNEAEIGLRAYQIWEAEGKPDGKSFEHWLRAEAELTTASRKPAKVPASTPIVSAKD